LNSRQRRNSSGFRFFGIALACPAAFFPLPFCPPRLCFSPAQTAIRRLLHILTSPFCPLFCPRGGENIFLLSGVAAAGGNPTQKGGYGAGKVGLAKKGKKEYNKLLVRIYGRKGS